MNIIMSIFAGLMIGLGGAANLIATGLTGAVFFSVGLYAILMFKGHLVTGKFSTIGNNGYHWFNYILCWFNNLIGTTFAALICLMSSKYDAICDGAIRVFSIRTTNTFVENIGLGILCGICVFIAVAGYARNSHPITVMLPVAIFVFCGFNHCVADMFYFIVAGKLLTAEAWIALAATTIGNFLGCAVPAMLINIDVRSAAP